MKYFVCCGNRKYWGAQNEYNTTLYTVTLTCFLFTMTNPKTRQRMKLKERDYFIIRYIIMGHLIVSIRICTETLLADRLLVKVGNDDQFFYRVT